MEYLHGGTCLVASAASPTDELASWYAYEASREMDQDPRSFSTSR
ncbi:hypothetical protein [Rhodococcus sp. T9N]|nr:hypothetical protein [Rhodococcus sp. T9N]